MELQDSCRVVIDVNVFLASFFFQSRIGDEILDAVRIGYLTLLVCDSFESELNRKIEQFSTKLDQESIIKIQNSLEFFGQIAEYVEMNSQLAICRDPRDDYLINLAIDGRADYLITRDRDLLEVKNLRISQVVITPEKFVKHYRILTQGMG